MEPTSRRTFFRRAASLLSALVFSRRSGAGSTALPDDSLDQDLLRAVGQSVLPGELDLSGRDRVLAGFLAWLKEYRPEAELDHGYGTSEIRQTPSHPAPRWASQLRALALEAFRRHRRAFGELSDEERQALIRSQISGDRFEDLPPAAEARHVAVGLLAFYYASPEATDLCYQAEVGKDTCRDLDDSRQEPAPIRPDTMKPE